MMGVDFMPLVIVLGFIGFDILTGLIKAFKENGYNSTIMREGGYHKSMEVIAVVGAYLLEYAIKYVDLGINIPAVSVVVAYICIMEFISILENMCAVNPELCALFKPYLEKLKGGNDETK